MVDYSMSDVFGISKSKLRRDLFVLYFSNPDKEYYLRELERQLGYSVGNIRRELVKLEKTGLFFRRARGNQVCYALNKDHALYKEIANVVMKTIGIEGAIRDIVAADPGIETAYIYGSYAAGRPSAQSDVDVLIIGEPDEPRLMREIDKLEKKVQREINYTIYSEDEYERRLETGDSFIANLNERPKIVLKDAYEKI
jgi:predicted nucleotidyltransferase